MRLYSELSDQQEPTLGLVRETLSIVQSVLDRHYQDIQRGYTRPRLFMRGQLAGRDLIFYAIN